MSVATEISSIQAMGIVAGVPINCPFPAYETTDISVVYCIAELVAVPGVDYAVVLSPPNFDTFTVTPTASLIAKIDALILADPLEVNKVDIYRDLDFKTSSTSPAVTFSPFTSREFDRTVLRDQQLSRRISREVQDRIDDVDAEAEAREAADDAIIGIITGGGSGSGADAIKLFLELDQVDNTTDLNKPISTATQTALNGKQNSIVVTSRPALKALDTAKTTYAVLIEGVRSGPFRWTTGDFSTHIAADTQEGVYVKADAFAATVGAWVRIGFADYDVRFFGADTAASASANVTAWQAAINLAALHKKALVASGGTYSLNAQLTWSGGLSLLGAGMGQTILSWAAGAASRGLSGTLTTNSYDFVLIADLTLEIFGYNAGTTGIYINGAAQISAGNIQDRYSPRVVIRDVYLRGNVVWNDGWDFGIDLESVINSSFVRPYFTGRLNGNTYTYSSTCAFKTRGAGNPCVVTIDRPVITAAITAIQNNDVEGVLVIGPTLVAVRNGIVAQNANPADLQPQLVVSGGHINQSGAGIIAQSVWALSVTGMHICGISDTPRITDAILVRDNSKAFNITNNTFENTSAVWGMTGVTCDTGTTAGLIDNNVFTNQTTAMLLTAASSKIRVGAGNINTNNPIGGNANWIVNSGTDNEVATRSFTKQISVTLTNVVENFVFVSIPSGIFTAKPVQAILTDAQTGQYIVALYDYANAGTTAVQCTFWYKRSDAVAMTAGAHTFSFTAIGY